MAGIYLHIPFCRQACHYCNFHFSTSLNRKSAFVEALLNEIELRKEYIGREVVETIYFGGGTPSLLSGEELRHIMAGLRAAFTVADDAEITLEANPDDVDLGFQAEGDPIDHFDKIVPGRNTVPEKLVVPGKLNEWKSAGINRLSIGVQSFFAEDLLWMNRVHNAEQARNCIRMAQDAGLDNISIDLIYGTPTLSDEHWRRNVEEAMALGIPHLSCYALTVEPKTALDKMITLKKKASVDPEVQARQFLSLTDWLSAAGYEHYEISNFALPGKRSRHNSSYWQAKNYLGLGPSAHSFNGHSRQWNVANNAVYIDILSGKEGELHGQSQGEPSGKALFETEVLTRVQQLNENIMISLRTLEGLSLDRVTEKFGARVTARLRGESERYIRENKMVEQSGRLILTKEGRLLADGIAAHLFFDEAAEQLLTGDDRV